MNLTPEELEDLLKRNPDLKVSTQISTGRCYADILTEEVKNKQNKYHVAPREERTYKGVVYASKGEMNYYIEKLEPRLLSRELDYVLRQVPFDLGGDPVVVYKADFVLLVEAGEERFWSVTVVEFKGHETKEWIIKRKLFKERYPKIKLEIVR